MSRNNKIARLGLFLGALILTQNLWGKDPVSLWFWTDEHKQHWQTQLKNVSALKKAYESDQIVGLELLIAEPSDTSALQSRFGHAFLRFVGSSGRSNTPSADLSVNFVANVHTQQLSARAGLVGEYAILPEVLPIGHSLNRYLALEKRPLRRIVIPSSPEMRAELIETLLTWWDELQQARPIHLQKEYEKAKTKAFEKYADFPKKDLLLVELPHPQRGVLGYSVINLKEHELSGQKIQELRAALPNSQKRLDFLNQTTKKKLIQKLSQKRKDHQMLIQQGSYLHVLPKEHPEFNWVDKKTLRGDLPNGMVVGLPLIGAKKTHKDKLLLVPVQKWRELELETHAIIPDFAQVRPPRVPIKDLGNYTFLGKNCASTLIQFFEKAELPARPGRTLARRMPLKLDEFLQESLLAPYPEVRLDNLAQMKNELLKRLELKSLQKLESTQMSRAQQESFDLFFQENPSAAQALFYFVPEINEQDRTWLLPLAQNNVVDFATLHGLKNLDQDLYKLCSTKACSAQLQKRLKQVFGAKALKDSREKMRRHTRQPLSPRDYSRVGRRRHHRPHRVYYKRPELVRHLHLIDFLGPRFPLARNNP